MTVRARQRHVFYGPPLPEPRNAAGQTFRVAGGIMLARLRRQMLLTEAERRDISRRRAAVRDEMVELETALRVYQNFGSPADHREGQEP